MSAQDNNATTQCTTTRRYTVHVRETRVFWDTLDVEAQTEDEATELARDLFECDWDNSDCDVIVETVVAIDGKAV